MKFAGYLRVKRTGQASVVKDRPDLGTEEIAIPFRIEIPDELFAPPKLPTVEIVLNESILPQVRAINSSLEALQDAGVTVRLVDDKQPESRRQ